MKNVLVINDLSGFGNCSLTVNLPVLQNTGLKTHAVASFLLSRQSDYDDFYAVNQSDFLTETLKRYAEDKNYFDCVLSGYLRDEKSIAAVDGFLTDFKGLKVIDTVFADDGKLYKGFSEKQVALYKELIKKADIITPNITEACFLCDTDYEEFLKVKNEKELFEKINGLFNALSPLTDAVIYITGAVVNGKIYSFVADKEGVFTAYSKDNGYRFSGSGDLFTSIITGETLNGTNSKKALSKAVKFIKKAADYSVKNGHYGNDGLLYQKFLKKL